MSSISSTGSDSSISDSASVSATSTIIPSDTGPTFTRPTSPPTRSNFNGGGGGNNGNAFASSGATSLYLYTFLATLVLLLLVSGAVVARSITLRVRARRALEESIRNGTYVPPLSSLGASNAPKPRFHDARVNDRDIGGLTDEKFSQWGNIVPVAASFVPSKSPRPLPQPATSATPRVAASLTSRIRNLNPFRAVQIQEILDELASRDPHSRLTPHQTPQPSQAEMAAAAFGSPPTNEENADQQVSELPSAVRVAVIIAMPDPARPISSHVSDDTSSSSSTKGKMPASGNTSGSDDEGEMPYVEFGVADVPLASVARTNAESPATSPASPPRMS